MDDKTIVYYEGGHGGWTRCFYGEMWGRTYWDFYDYSLKEIAYLLRHEHGWHFSKMVKIGD